jgi:hypothetical protein
MSNFYEVIIDMGCHPEMYSIATIGEIRSFIDGYRFAINQADSRLVEVPPFSQFTEWLVRKLERGNTSFGWWQLIRWNDTDDATAIRDFGMLIAEFSKRQPAIVAEAMLDTVRHCPTGKFNLGSMTNGVYTDFSAVSPLLVRLTKYSTDDGIYLEYHYDRGDCEHYCASIAAAKRRAYEDFQIEDADWSGGVGAE